MALMQCPACNYFMSDLDAECPRCRGKGLAAPQVMPQAAPVSTPATPQSLLMDKNEKYIDRMNERMDRQDNSNRLFNRVIGGYFLLLGGLIALIIIALILGSIWTAIFGPSK